MARRVLTLLIVASCVNQLSICSAKKQWAHTVTRTSFEVSSQKMTRLILGSDVGGRILSYLSYSSHNWTCVQMNPAVFSSDMHTRAKQIKLTSILLPPSPSNSMYFIYIYIYAWTWLKFSCNLICCKHLERHTDLLEVRNDDR